MEEEEKVTNKDEVKTSVVEPNPKELFFERIRTNIPDASYDEDENQYFLRAMDWMNDKEKELELNSQFNRRLSERFREDPRQAAALIDFLESGNLPAAIRRHIGDEAMYMEEGDEGWEEYVQAEKDKRKDIDDARALMDEIIKNKELTIQAMEDFAAENNMDAEEKEAFWQYMIADLEKISKGLYDKDILSKYKKSYDHDKDVESAETRGAVNERNKKIVAERKHMGGDGLPGVGGSGDSMEETPKAKIDNPTAEFFSRINGKENIWNKGK